MRSETINRPQVGRESVAESQHSTALLDGYVSRDELALELRVTVRTLDKWAWLRKGPPKVRIGARVYYHRDDVREFLAEQRRVAKGGGAE